MKKAILIFSLSVCSVVFHSVIGADRTRTVSPDDTIDGLSGVISTKQYIALAKVVVENKDKIASDASDNIIRSMVKRALEKATTPEEKLSVLAEISVMLSAVASGFETVDERAGVAETILDEVISTTEGSTMDKAVAAKWALAGITVVSSSVASESLVAKAAAASLPADIKEEADTAVKAPTSILGGKLTWACKELYRAVRMALYNKDDLPEDNVAKVTTSTTTTTTTTTSTTTTVAGARPIPEEYRRAYFEQYGVYPPADTILPEEYRNYPTVPPYPTTTTRPGREPAPVIPTTRPSVTPTQPNH